jgi:hypothetical protein
VPLNETQRVNVVAVLARASDEYLAQPLWNFHPYYAPFVLSARARRNVLQHDPEPSGDPEYS